ncbi:hypothetical protein KC351_g13 [Hortaea werneckii]|nr:hypothetical protein KC351_g13 [Hortaea werneckii]
MRVSVCPHLGRLRVALVSQRVHDPRLETMSACFQLLPAAAQGLLHLDEQAALRPSVARAARIHGSFRALQISFPKRSPSTELRIYGTSNLTSVVSEWWFLARAKLALGLRLRSAEQQIPRTGLKSLWDLRQ